MKKILLLLSLFLIPVSSYAYDDINFDTDSSQLSPAAEAQLRDIAADANSTSSKVIVIGHADERGQRVYNLLLGQRRADAVAEKLQSLGVEAQTVVAVSYGEERPLAPNGIREHLAANRRVEIIAVKANVIIEQKEVIVEKEPRKNRIMLFGGGGPHTLDQTNKGTYVDIEWEFKPVFGLGYSRLLTDRFSLGVMGLSNATFGLTAGFDF